MGFVGEEVGVTRHSQTQGYGREPRQRASEGRSVVGQHFGHYRVTEKIGEGGMAEVFAAQHQLLGKQVAVKLLRPQMSMNEDIVRRFFNEAQAAARIEHPSITSVLDYGYTPQGNAYLVMELLKGENLRQRLKRLEKLPLDMSIRVMRQLASVMQAAHRHGIVHRDLKPDNIFLVPDADLEGGERVKVLDFGLAKLAELAGSVVTAAGAVFGTPAYMAPEQALDAGRADHRADIYALGCIFYRCICGTAPFGFGGINVMMAHLNHTPRPLIERQPDTPPHLDAIVMRMLEKAPERRFQSCDEFLGALLGRAPGPGPDGDFVEDARTTEPMKALDAREYLASAKTKILGSYPKTLAAAAVPIPPSHASQAGIWAPPSPPPSSPPRAAGERGSDAGHVITGELSAAAPAPLSTAAIAALPSMELPSLVLIEDNADDGDTDRVEVSEIHSESRSSLQAITIARLAPPPAPAPAQMPRGVIAALLGTASALLALALSAALLSAGDDAGEGEGVRAVAQEPGEAAVEVVTPAPDDPMKEVYAALEQARWDQAADALERARSADDGTRSGEIAVIANRIAAGREAKVAFMRFQAAVAEGEFAEVVEELGKLRALPAADVYEAEAGDLYRDARADWERTLSERAAALSDDGQCDAIAKLHGEAATVLGDGDGDPPTFDDVQRRCEQRRLARLVGQSRDAYRRAEYELAHRVCRQALDSAPDNAEALAVCGLAACKLSRGAKALRYLKALPSREQTQLRQSCTEMGVSLKAKPKPRGGGLDL